MARDVTEPTMLVVNRGSRIKQSVSMRPVVSNWSASGCYKDFRGVEGVSDGGPEHARVAEPDEAKTSGSAVGRKSAGGRSYGSPRLVVLEPTAAPSNPRLDPVRHHLQTALERYFAMLIILTWVNASSPS